LFRLIWNPTPNVYYKQSSADYEIQLLRAAQSEVL